MKENSKQPGRFTQHGHGLGTVTEQMVRERAAELALINGRPPGQILDSDLSEARRELTGQETVVPEPTPAENLTEEQRWQPIPDNAGQKTPSVEAPDEQTFAEELVEEGLEDAEEDSMVQGTRRNQHKDREQ